MFSIRSSYLLTWMLYISVYNTKNKALYNIYLRIFTLTTKSVKKFIKNYTTASIHENLCLVYVMNGKLVCCNASLPISPEWKTLE